MLNVQHTYNLKRIYKRRHCIPIICIKSPTLVKLNGKNPHLTQKMNGNMKFIKIIENNVPVIRI